jgi:hypothetical protein
MAGPNLVSYQGPANTQNPNTSEIPVSAANPLPVTITEGNLSLGNVSVVSSAGVPALYTAPTNGTIASSSTVNTPVTAAIAYAWAPALGLNLGIQTGQDGTSTTGNVNLAVIGMAQCLPTGTVSPQQFGNLALDGPTHALMVLSQGDKYINISTSTTTTVKSTPGVVKSVIINTLGTVASTTTIKDGNTTVAIINSLTLSGTFNLNATCTANITCVTTGTSPPNVTVTYQ